LSSPARADPRELTSGKSHHYARRKKEGAFAPPGVEYSCDGGFAPNDRDFGYTGEQMQAIEGFKGTYETRLREILEC